MSEITRGVVDMPYEMAMGSEISRRQFYEIAREVYAENHRLLESLQSMIDQTTPLVPIPGDPMWSRRVTIDELKTENELLTKAIGLQVVRRFAGDDDQKNIDELVAAGIQVDKELIAQINAENESLRKDADRYRWLIDNAEEIYFFGTNLHLDTYYWGREKVHAEADKQIDAAISSPENPS